MLRRQGWIAVLAVVLGACSSTAVVVSPSTVWPFKRFDILVGRVPGTVAFYSRPEVSPAYLIAVIQSPPCKELHDTATAGRSISTSGVLWNQFRLEAAFVQFERIGPASPADRLDSADCTPAMLARFTPEIWTRQTQVAIAAIRRSEGLRNLKTIYLGLGEGAPIAMRLASQDSTVAALIVVNGGGLNARFEQLIRTLRRQRPGFFDPGSDAHAEGIADEHASQFSDRRAVSHVSAPAETLLPDDLPILVVHASEDDHMPVESSLQLYASLAVRHQKLSMLVLNGYSHDLDLSERPECFESALRLVAARSSRMLVDAPIAGGRFEQLDCASALQEFPAE